MRRPGYLGGASEERVGLDGQVVALGWRDLQGCPITVRDLEVEYVVKHLYDLYLAEMMPKLLEERVGDRLRARDEKLGELERQLLPLR